MRTKIIKIIISDEGKEFKINDDIHFYLNRENKIYDCFGVVIDINENDFIINKVQIDKMNVSDLLTIRYSEVKDGIIL